MKLQRSIASVVTTVHEDIVFTVVAMKVTVKNYVRLSHQPVGNLAQIVICQDSKQKNVGEKQKLCKYSMSHVQKATFNLLSKFSFSRHNSQWKSFMKLP